MLWALEELLLPRSGFQGSCESSFQIFNRQIQMYRRPAAIVMTFLLAANGRY